MDSRMQDAPNNAPLKRDHDSVDDFEHLGDPAGFSDEQRTDQQQQCKQHQQPLTVDDAVAPPPPPPRVDDLLRISGSFQAPDFALPSAFLSNDDDDDDDETETKPVPATPPPSADFEKSEAMAQSSDPFQRSLDPMSVDPKLASVTFVENERSHQPRVSSLRDDRNDETIDDETILQPPLLPTIVDHADPLASKSKIARDANDKSEKAGQPAVQECRYIATDQAKWQESKIAPASSADLDFDEDFMRVVKSSILPSAVKRSFDRHLLDENARKVKNIMDDDSWNVVEKTEDVKREQLKEREPPTKPLPPLPREAELNVDKYEMSNDFPIAETAARSAPDPESANKRRQVPRQEPPSRSKETDYTCPRPVAAKKKEEIEIAPKEIFRDMGLDAWFNPERLNPKVAALIYWRDPKKSGIIFGLILGVLLSLAYFSLISVLAYLSLLTLSGTVLFRIYKTILQAVQKTSDGHPFKDILDLDLALSAEKVHDFADVAVAHANAAVSELRRLFLVEDFVDSIKFGVLLWCLTYVGSWFNGMTLIICGVVALFTLPKVYETNQEQIDQNLALVQAKINEITAKVKAAIPLGKKEPIKEE